MSVEKAGPRLSLPAGRVSVPMPSSKSSEAFSVFRKTFTAVSFMCSS